MLLIIYCALRKTGVDKKYLAPHSKIGFDFYFDEFDWLIFIYELENILAFEIQEERMRSSITISDLVFDLYN